MVIDAAHGLDPRTMFHWRMTSALVHGERASPELVLISQVGTAVGNLACPISPGPPDA
jgi:hypothetical protein